MKLLLFPVKAERDDVYESIGRRMEETRQRKRTSYEEKGKGSWSIFYWRKLVFFLLKKPCLFFYWRNLVYFFTEETLSIFLLKEACLFFYWRKLVYFLLKEACLFFTEGSLSIFYWDLYLSTKFRNSNMLISSKLLFEINC